MANITHNHPAYLRRWRNSNDSVKYNGAYYYSVELVKNVIPLVGTARPWVTVNINGYCHNNAIVFIHNNKHPENYAWLRRYQNLVLVCSIKSTMEKVKKYGEHVIHVPLSVDIDEVAKFRRAKTRTAAYVGRKSKARGLNMPDGIDYICNLPRPQLLAKMAEYDQVYAVGRCAIEAKILGCEVLPYDLRYPDPSIWEVRDNWETVATLQTELDRIGYGTGKN